ncbi:MAG: SpoIID/LytB domain-containing protein [Vulcanococcus sp.]
MAPAVPFPAAGPSLRRLLPSVLALGLLAGGCRPAAALIRPPVPAPPAVGAGSPQLWVALAAHLGQGPLRLEGAAGPLQLVDGHGQRHSAAVLELRWRSVPLAQPLQLERQVLGPFPSFESAEQVALAWGRGGQGAVVAHPRDWEVWAEPGLMPPAGQRPRLQRLQLSRQLQPELRSGGRWVRLEGPLQIQAPRGLRWQGGTFAGPFRLQADAYGSWSLVEQVPLERYLEGVLPHEIGASAPAAALAAQAVLARTWALRNQHRFAVDGYHLCADTQCQVYGDPRQAGAAVRQAIRSTSGKVLALEGRPIHAVYHASNGGISADEHEAWPLPALTYLEPALDLQGAAPPGLSGTIDSTTELRQLLALRQGVAGSAHPLFRWRRQVDQSTLRQALGARAAALGSPLRPVVLERGPSGRVVKLAIEGPTGRVVLERDAIRRSLRLLPSTLFLLSAAGPGVWWFEGGGFGHGAGLSQAGAIDLAARGWSVERILRHYYPGTSLLPLGALAPAKPSGGGL